MSDYFGDIRLGDTIDIKFTTRQISGAPFTLAGSPVISAYPSNSTTQLTAGITLTVDFDTVTGYNNVRVVASGGNGYLTATNYDLCITTGTVNSVSVVGESIGSFSIENRSALMPATAGRTAVVDAAGLVDSNMVKAGPSGSGSAQTAGDIPGKTNSLTFTGANKVDASVRDWIGGAIPAVNVTGVPLVDLKYTLGTISPAAAGSVRADTTFPANFSSLAITGGGAVTVGTNSDKTGYSLTQTFPANFASLAITAGGAVTVGTNSDKTGYSLSATGLNAVLVSDLAGVPATTASIVDALSFLFMGLRNLRTTTATQDKVSNDAGATIGTATVADDGTTFSKTKYS